RYDAETVLALARSRGDALGVRHTGVWTTTLEQVECDCPVSMVSGVFGQPSDPCQLIGPAFGITGTPMIEADGVLHMRLGLLSPTLGLELLGTIDDDGEVAVGEVSNLSSLVAELRTIVRLDGTIVDHEPDSLSGSWADLDGEVIARFDGQLAEQRIECGASYDIHAELATSFPPPD
ncbi:MAG: hypothetical protein IAG13_07070, partial [Deltaproteobacteria bacterium]|nr:hypothetical protein [Nannocystaceae bacterium]